MKQLLLIWAVVATAWSEVIDLYSGQVVGTPGQKQLAVKATITETHRVAFHLQVSTGAVAETEYANLNVTVVSSAIDITAAEASTVLKGQPVWSRSVRIPKEANASVIYSDDPVALSGEYLYAWIDMSDLTQPVTVDLKMNTVVLADASSTNPILNSLSDDNGTLTYNGAPVGSVTSVAGRDGDVTLGITDVANLSTSLSQISSDLQDRVTITNYNNGYQALTDEDARTDNPHQVTASQVGLGNVDNTADADKPISIAVQTALDAKLDADAYGQTFSAVSVLDATQVTLSSGATSLVYNVMNPSTGTVSVLDGYVTRSADKATLNFQMAIDEDDEFILSLASLIPAGGKILSVGYTSGNHTVADLSQDVFLRRASDTEITINRADSVDVDISFFLDIKIDGFEELNAFTVTAADVELGNVDNTSDLDKPISTATQIELDKKYSVEDAIDSLLGGIVSDYIVSNADAWYDFGNPRNGLNVNIDTGGGVLDVLDISASQSDASQVTVSKQGVLSGASRQNGRQYLILNSSQRQGMTSLIDYNNINCTVFCLYKLNNTPSGSVSNGLFGHDNGGWDKFAYFANGSFAVGGATTNRHIFTSQVNANPADPSVWNLVSVHYNGTGVNESKAWCNGKMLGNFTHSNTAGNAISGFGTLNPTSTSNAHYFGGYIAEFIVILDVVDDLTTRRIHEYIRRKWGVTGWDTISLL